MGSAFDTIDDVFWGAEASATITHKHPEGIKGAQAVALAIYCERMRACKRVIQEEINNRFGYDLSRSLVGFRPNYQ